MGLLKTVIYPNAPNALNAWCQPCEPAEVPMLAVSCSLFVFVDLLVRRSTLFLFFALRFSMDSLLFGSRSGLRHWARVLRISLSLYKTVCVIVSIVQPFPKQTGIWSVPLISSNFFRSKCTKFVNGLELISKIRNCVCLKSKGFACCVWNVHIQHIFRYCLLQCFTVSIGK